MKNYKKGAIIKGKINAIEKYGVFVELDKKASGLIHISEISSQFVKNVNDYFKLGEIVYVKVIGKKDDTHLKLSIKDIDYKYGDNQKAIKEEGEGFLPLAEKRPIWIKDKIKEMKRQENA